MARCDNCVGCPDDVEIHRLCDDCMQADIQAAEEWHAEKDAEIARLRAELAEARADVERERALREDAETRASTCEANHAGQIARLRDERESLRSVTRTWEMRCTEITRQRDAAVRDLAEARESASRYHAELVDSLRAVANERDAAIRERDARPEITVEDAALHEAWISHPHGEDEPVEMRNAVHRVSVALRTHAARATCLVRHLPNGEHRMSCYQRDRDARATKGGE